MSQQENFTMDRDRFSKRLRMPLGEAVETIAAVLHEEGFSLLTDADIMTAIGSELGIETVPHRILGFYNAHYCYQALRIDHRIGPMVTCTVAVTELRLGLSELTALYPTSVLEIAENEAITDLARDVSRCLKRGLNRIPEMSAVFA